MLYKHSGTYRFLALFWRGAKVNFKYSFLRRLSEAEYSPQLLDNSVLIARLLRIYRSLRDRIKSCLLHSAFTDMVGQAKRAVLFEPVKTGSIIILVVILTEIFLSLLLHKRIEPLGWTAKIFFIVIALGGLSCNTGWQDLRETSFILKWVNNH